MLRVNRFAAAMDMMAAGTSAPTPMAAYAMPAHQSGNIVSNSTGTMVLPSPPIGLTPKPMATYPSSANAAVSGQDPVMPIALSTASIPMSCSATYGMVATIPVSATAPASQRESNLARTNSAGVTNPCACVTDHSRAATTYTNGVVTSANPTAKKPPPPIAYTSAGTATNVYAVYRSPPSRNQVTQLPKARPPSPHCSR